MFNYDALSGLAGQKLFYVDEEQGIGWDIQVLETYRDHSSAATIALITDNIRVELSYLDVALGPHKILKKIYDTYKEALTKMEAANG